MSLMAPACRQQSAHRGFFVDPPRQRISKFSQRLFARTGAFTDALLIAGIMLVTGVMMPPLIRDRKHTGTP